MMDSIHKRPEPEKFEPEILKTICTDGKLEERDHYNFGWGRYVFKDIDCTFHKAVKAHNNNC